MTQVKQSEADIEQSLDAFQVALEGLHEPAE